MSYFIAFMDGNLHPSTLASFPPTIVQTNQKEEAWSSVKFIEESLYDKIVSYISIALPKYTMKGRDLWYLFTEKDYMP